MNEYHSDIVIRHINTKNKLRKITTYRSIDCPLRNKHTQINEFVEARFIPSIFSKGYVKKRSIYHNALSHMYNDYFLLLDIKDFFPHICHVQLAEKLYHELNLSKPNQISRNECSQLVKLCSTGSRGLPLGFITSPILSNVYLKEFDGILYGKLKKLGLNNIIYTRYADDLTISFRTERLIIEPIKEEIMEIVSSLLSRYGLQLNWKKTRFYSLKKSNHVKITGVNIIKLDNGKRKLTVGRQTKDEVFWQAMECFSDRDPEKIAHVKGLQSFILSIEKKNYEDSFSEGMKEMLHEKGYGSLEELINSL